MILSEKRNGTKKREFTPESGNVDTYVNLHLLREIECSHAYSLNKYVCMYLFVVAITFFCVCKCYDLLCYIN